MKKIILSFLVISACFQSCSNNDEDENQIIVPITYEFTRNGNSTVNFDGQTTRIQMAEALIAGLMDISKSESQLDAMFAHVQGANNFIDSNLNASDKNVRSKIAASQDYFSANTTAANAIKADFDGWIASQVNDVFPNWNVDASIGIAGKIQEAGGGPVRYVNAKGLEYNQAVNKGMIGALMVDQALNNYLSTSVLDASTNIMDNDNGVLEAGKNYTAMEHKWDEAYGYIYGLNENSANPNADLGADSFLNKYIGRVEGDTDFKGIADEIFQAFKLGRAAIVAKNYTIRNQQAQIIRELISEIIGIRAVYYLQQAKPLLATNKGAAFHDLSEGFGFIYSLQFTRKAGTNTPYFTKAEVDAFITTLTTGNGFWDITPATLDTMSNTIAAKFKFTVAQAGS
jgi:hypothetical protein